MSYLGSTPSAGTPFSNNKIQVLSGNGSNTQFTLDYRVNGKADIEVIVNNIQQNPFDGSYDVSNNNILTFSGAPSSGSNNIHIYFRGHAHNVSVPDSNSINSSQLTTTGVTAGVYGNSTAIPVITVDVAGRVTAASANALFENPISLGNTLTTKAIVPDANVTYDIGTSAKRFKDIYLANTTIYIGNTTVSETGGSLQISNAGAPAVNLATVTEATDLASNAYSNAIAYAASNTYVNNTFAPKASPTITGTASFADVTISGNLTTSGTTTYVNTTNLNIGDNIITLNADLGAAAPTENAGIEVMRGTSANVALRWNETSDIWQTTTDGTNYLTVATNNDVTTAYTNATSYADTIAGTAYTNAIAYAAANSYVNTQLGLKASLSGATFSGAVSGITTLATGNTTITGFANVSSTLQVGTNTATFGTAAYIAANGNVGIGVSSPRAPLDLGSQNNRGQVILLGEVGTNTRVGLGLDASNAGMRLFTFNSSDQQIELGGIASDGSTWTRSHRFGVAGGNSFVQEQGGNFGIGTSSPVVSLDLGSKTDAIRLPVGNTAARPSNTAGLVRYNTDTNAMEYFSNTAIGAAWVSVGILDGSSPGAAAPSGYYIAQNFPGFTSGYYWIKSNSMPTALQMYVDMTQESGGYDFYAIQGGTAVTYYTDTHSGTALGLDVVYPRSKYHWIAMRNFVSNILGSTNYTYFSCVPGIYRTTNSGNGGSSNYTGKIMRSSYYGGNYAPDWRVKDGGRWWLRDTTFTEPNGDYASGAWLGALDGHNGLPNGYTGADIGFNDGTASYNTGSYYLVSTNTKP